MAVVLVAKFAGDVTRLTRAYDEAHRVIMERGGAPGELRHHCAVGDDALWLIGVWESEELLRARFASAELEELLVSVGFPSPKTDARRALHRGDGLSHREVEAADLLALHRPRTAYPEENVESELNAPPEKISVTVPPAPSSLGP